VSRSWFVAAASRSRASGAPRAVCRRAPRACGGCACARAASRT